MSSISFTSSQPGIHITSSSSLLILSSKPCILPMRAPLLKYERYKTISRHQPFLPVCLFGGKGKNEANNGGSPWKAFENAIGNFKKGNSIEDLLRQQIDKKEYYDGGGSNTPPGGGDGGGSGGGNSLGGSEDEGFAGIIDETVQVVLATIGFIFMYIYIINGEEMIRLAKDYIKYVFGGGKSIRLKRAMFVWRRLVAKLTEKKVPHSYYYENNEWLGQMIVETPTLWHQPEQKRRIICREEEELYSDEEDSE